MRCATTQWPSIAAATTHEYDEAYLRNNHTTRHTPRNHIYGSGAQHRNADNEYRPHSLGYVR